MDHAVPLSFVTWLLGFLISLLVGCWAIFKFFESKLNQSTRDFNEKLTRLYERIDENKRGYYNDFVLTKVLSESNNARKEIVDEKFESLLRLFTEKNDGFFKLFNEKIESLRNEIKNLTGRTKDHVN